jgi:pimeloyl-ACP methyl ester carboxylesterase
MKCLTAMIVLLAVAGAQAHASDRIFAGETAIQFEASNGETADAFEGRITVPENRSDAQSRVIELAYVRFPATGEQPGNPIVYLAGGPGGSGIATARGPRFSLFMEMRRHGDVIAFDQRGTGQSTALPDCESGIVLDSMTVHTDEEVADAFRAAARECREFWFGEGVDIANYTTLDSVADLSAVRAHFGAEQITLWGISYGSHLALAAIDWIPDEIDRAVLASVEGLDQTVKLPARTDAYFQRLQAAIDTQPAAAAIYPDLPGLIRRVHARLDEQPMETALGLIQRADMQQLASFLISDPSRVSLLAAIYAQLDAGETAVLEGMIARFGGLDAPIRLRAMPTAMDVASGISAERLALFEAQAPDGIIGRYLNAPMPQLAGLWPDLDLGDEFRAGPVGDIPVLMLSGTLDGRTYPESQHQAVAGLSRVTAVTVVNAGHNLFMSSPDVAAAIHRFMQNEDGIPAEIVVDLPDFTASPF